MESMTENYSSMNLNRLWIFHIAATLKNFSRAAEELHLTQPGISKHIKELERHYGTALFKRLTRKVALTEAGEILFANTKGIFNTLDETRTKINDLSGFKGGKLQIGGSVTIGTYILPEIIKSFTEAYPGIDISVTISLSEEIEEKVLSDGIEIGLVAHEIAANDKLDKMEFMIDRIILIAPPNHPLARRKEVTVDELKGETIIQPSRRSGTRTFIEKKVREKVIQPGKIIYFGTTNASKRAVEAGLGISFTSSLAVKRELEMGLVRAIPVLGLDLQRRFYAVFRRGKYISNAAHAFLGLIKGQIEIR